jgi:hypothetical protein
MGAGGGEGSFYCNRVYAQKVQNLSKLKPVFRNILNVIKPVRYEIHLFWVLGATDTA